MEAWEKVKSNKGSAGIDNETIEEFEKNLKSNLYRIWNRMSSGSYFPPPVKVVEIPKKNGGKRGLGIPTVSDRIAQMVCKIYMEPVLEKIFHKDSYGYRPFKSGHQALKQCRQRCWEYDWALDLDIKGFFDNIDHELMMKAVKHHFEKKWIILYVERWLKAEAQMPYGTLKEREKGTPQGGVISPLLANLFLHYAFDRWLENQHSNVKFERYADDIIVHCRSKEQAMFFKDKIKERLQECNLELHPDKTKIVYCKDSNRNWKYKQIEFNFLGYTFKPRKARNKERECFTSFQPAISKEAGMKIKEAIRKWKIPNWVGLKIEEIALIINRKTRGWINYYGFFYKTALKQIFHVLDCKLVRWVMSKYKKFRGRWLKAFRWLGKVAKENRGMFVNWELVKHPKG